MDKIIAVSFDIADQVVKTYNALEWHNFIADTRELVTDDWDDEVLSLDDLFDTAYGDEFWYEECPKAFELYDVAFYLPTERFILCHNDADCEAVVAWAEDIGDPEDIFWA